MKESKDGKEMLGGCCVCSDDRGWTENPLVYCDGQGCNVAVHQACYGIVSVPSGPWYCRKCESQERAARVRCELCPSKDGALKRTESSSIAWAHVVCALYIPEVRFGNVTTMEPIILSMVPQDRYNKSCYICESQGREAKSKIGACMNCNKPGCKLHFHVTCAQAMGLLCEEAGNFQDNVKYCGYCQHHYSKLKRGANLKTIPAFKPVPPIDAISESNSSEKLNAIQASGSSWAGQSPAGASNGSKEKQRKKPGRKSGSQVLSKVGNSRDSTSSSVIVEGPNVGDDSKTKKNEVNPMYINVLAGVGLVPGPRVTMNDQSSNNVEKHESTDSLKQENARGSETTKTSGMKKSEKFIDSSKQAPSVTSGAPFAFSELPSMTNSADKSRTARRKGSTRSVSPTSQGGNDTESTLSNVSDPGLTSVPDSSVVGDQYKGASVNKYDTPTVPEPNSSVVHSVIVSSASTHHSESSSSTQVQSVPQRAVSPLIISTSAGSSSQSQSSQAKLNYSNMFENVGNGKDLSASTTPAKKARRGRAPKVSAPVAPDSPPSSPDSAGVEQLPKRRKKATKSSALALHNDDHIIVAVNRAEDFLSEHLNQSALKTDNVLNKEIASTNPMIRANFKVNKTLESTTHLHNPSPLPVNHVGVKDLNSHKENVSSGKDSGLFLRNGIAVPHMLGNQLNPNSSVAQQLTDTLAAEIEAHSITNQPSPIGSNNLTGVPFPVRVVSPSLRKNLPSGSTATPFPQTMEQLLERQWEQGSQFLMGQAQQYDIASLLSCLHSLRQENMRLEDQVADLKGRRDRLLLVQARLSLPLAVQPSQMAYTNTGTNSIDRSTPVPGHASGHPLRASPQERDRNNRGTPYLPQMENGIGLSEHLSAFMGTAFSNPHGSQRNSASSSHQSDRVVPSPVIVSSRTNPIYHPVPSGGNAVSIPSTMSPVQGSSSFMSEGRNLTVLRSPSSTPEMRPEVARSTGTPSQPPYAYQIVSPPLSVPPHHPGSYANMVTTMSNANQLNARRDGSDSRHPIGRPSPIERR